MRLILVSFLLVTCQHPQWVWKNTPLELEIAQTPQQRRQGLQNHAPLQNNEGMLFIYPQPRKVSFWMKNVSFPIDLGFFSDSGDLLAIHSLKPYDETPIASPGPIQFALEMRLGWFAEKNFQIGDIWPQLPQENPLNTR